MNISPENFCYWLQGFFEIQNPETLDATQVQIIKDHLATVFTKVTPDRGEIKVAPSGVFPRLDGAFVNPPEPRRYCSSLFLEEGREVTISDPPRTC